MDVDVGLQVRLDAVAAQLGHSLSLDDPHGRLIAYSAQDAGADPARIASILSRQVAPEIQDWQNRHGIANATGPIQVPANPELGMTARLCVPIRQGRRCLGYLWVLQAGPPLEPAAIDMLTRFGRELAGSKRTSALGWDIGVLIRRLLGAAPDAGLIDELVAIHPALLDSSVTVCVAVPVVEGREAVAPLTGSTFARLSVDLPAGLRRNPAYVGSFVGATHAVILLRQPPTTQMLAELAEFAADEIALLTIGISAPATFDVVAMREAYRQALTAAELAALDPVLPSPLSWTELGPYRAFVRSGPLTGRTLNPLDNAGASAQMLIHTLETYLDLGGDAQRTAERLHLHRTTLYYRLGRIARLLDADLGDGLTRLDLHLALKGRRAARRRLTGAQAEQNDSTDAD